VSLWTYFQFLRKVLSGCPATRSAGRESDFRSTCPIPRPSICNVFFQQMQYAAFLFSHLRLPLCKDSFVSVLAPVSTYYSVTSVTSFVLNRHWLFCCPASFWSPSPLVCHFKSVRFHPHSSHWSYTKCLLSYGIVCSKVKRVVKLSNTLSYLIYPSSDLASRTSVRSSNSAADFASARSPVDKHIAPLKIATEAEPLPVGRLRYVSRAILPVGTAQLRRQTFG
jgi:hypothetical protein